MDILVTFEKDDDNLSLGNFIIENHDDENSNYLCRFGGHVITKGTLLSSRVRTTQMKDTHDVKGDNDINRCELLVMKRVICPVPSESLQPFAVIQKVKDLRRHSKESEKLEKVLGSLEGSRRDSGRSTVFSDRSTVFAERSTVFAELESIPFLNSINITAGETIITQDDDTSNEKSRSTINDVDMFLKTLHKEALNRTRRNFTNTIRLQPNSTTMGKNEEKKQGSEEIGNSSSSSLLCRNLEDYHRNENILKIYQSRSSQSPFIGKKKKVDSTVLLLHPPTLHFEIDTMCMKRERLKKNYDNMSFSDPSMRSTTSSLNSSTHLFIFKIYEKKSTTTLQFSSNQSSGKNESFQSKKGYESDLSGLNSDNSEYKSRLLFEIHQNYINGQQVYSYNFTLPQRRQKELQGIINHDNQATELFTTLTFHSLAHNETTIVLNETLRISHKKVSQEAEWQQDYYSDHDDFLKTYFPGLKRRHIQCGRRPHDDEGIVQRDELQEEEYIPHSRRQKVNVAIELSSNGGMSYIPVMSSLEEQQEREQTKIKSVPVHLEYIDINPIHYISVVKSPSTLLSKLLSFPLLRLFLCYDHDNWNPSSSSGSHHHYLHWNTNVFHQNDENLFITFPHSITFNPFFIDLLVLSTLNFNDKPSVLPSSLLERFVPFLTLYWERRRREKQMMNNVTTVMIKRWTRLPEFIPSAPIMNAPVPKPSTVNASTVSESTANESTNQQRSLLLGDITTTNYLSIHVVCKFQKQKNNTISENGIVNFGEVLSLAPQQHVVKNETNYYQIGYTYPSLQCRNNFFSPSRRDQQEKKTRVSALSSIDIVAKTRTGMMTLMHLPVKGTNLSTDRHPSSEKTKEKHELPSIVQEEEEEEETDEEEKTLKPSDLVLQGISSPIEKVYEDKMNIVYGIAYTNCPASFTIQVVHQRKDLNASSREDPNDNSTLVPPSFLSLAIGSTMTVRCVLISPGRDKQNISHSNQRQRSKAFRETITTTAKAELTSFQYECLDTLFRKGGEYLTNDSNNLRSLHHLRIVEMFRNNIDSLRHEKNLTPRLLSKSIYLRLLSPLHPWVAFPNQIVLQQRKKNKESTTHDHTDEKPYLGVFSFSVEPSVITSNESPIILEIKGENILPFTSSNQDEDNYFGSRHNDGLPFFCRLDGHDIFKGKVTRINYNNSIPLSDTLGQRNRKKYRISCPVSFRTTSGQTSSWSSRRGGLHRIDISIDQGETFTSSRTSGRRRHPFHWTCNQRRIHNDLVSSRYSFLCPSSGFNNVLHIPSSTIEMNPIIVISSQQEQRRRTSSTLSKKAMANVAYLPLWLQNREALGMLRPLCELTSLPSSNSDKSEEETITKKSRKQYIKGIIAVIDDVTGQRVIRCLVDSHLTDSIRLSLNFGHSWLQDAPILLQKVYYFDENTTTFGKKSTTGKSENVQNTPNTPNTPNVQNQSEKSSSLFSDIIDDFLGYETENQDTREGTVPTPTLKNLPMGTPREKKTKCSISLLSGKQRGDSILEVRFKSCCHLSSLSNDNIHRNKYPFINVMTKPILYQAFQFKLYKVLNSATSSTSSSSSSSKKTPEKEDYNFIGTLIGTVETVLSTGINQLMIPLPMSKHSSLMTSGLYMLVLDREAGDEGRNERDDKKGFDFFDSGNHAKKSDSSTLFLALTFTSKINDLSRFSHLMNWKKDNFRLDIRHEKRMSRQLDEVGGYHDSIDLIGDRGLMKLQLTTKYWDAPKGLLYYSLNKKGNRQVGEVSGSSQQEEPSPESLEPSPESLEPSSKHIFHVGIGISHDQGQTYNYGPRPVSLFIRKNDSVSSNTFSLRLVPSAFEVLAQKKMNQQFGIGGTEMNISQGVLGMSYLPDTIVTLPMFVDHIVQDLSLALGLGISEDHMLVPGNHRLTVDRYPLDQTGYHSLQSGIFRVKCYETYHYSITQSDEVVNDNANNHSSSSKTSSEVPYLTCKTIKRTIKDMLKRKHSRLYDGILTWALDPLFFDGNECGRVAYLDEKNNFEPVVTIESNRGICRGNERLLCERQCNKYGNCDGGVGCEEGFDNELECNSLFTISGQRCRWIPRFFWEPYDELDGLREEHGYPSRRSNESSPHHIIPLHFGKCIDIETNTTLPGLSNDEITCLNNNGIHVPSNKFRCELFQGSNDQRSSLQQQTPINDYLSCINANGKCTYWPHQPNSETSGYNPTDYFDKETCEEPSKRSSNIRDRNDKELGKRRRKKTKSKCVFRTGNPTWTLRFDYNQFNNSRDLCESPKTRLKSIHSSSLPGICLSNPLFRRHALQLLQSHHEEGDDSASKKKCQWKKCLTTFYSKSSCVDNVVNVQKTLHCRHSSDLSKRKNNIQPGHCVPSPRYSDTTQLPQGISCANYLSRKTCEEKGSRGGEIITADHHHVDNELYVTKNNMLTSNDLKSSSLSPGGSKRNGRLISIEEQLLLEGDGKRVGPVIDLTKLPSNRDDEGSSSFCQWVSKTSFLLGGKHDDPYFNTDSDKDDDDVNINPCIWETCESVTNRFQDAKEALAQGEKENEQYRICQTLLQGEKHCPMLTESESNCRKHGLRLYCSWDSSSNKCIYTGPPGTFVTSDDDEAIDTGRTIKLNSKVNNDDGGLGPSFQWVSENKWISKNRWEHGFERVDPCPCDWRSIPYHLTKCNWVHCGPSCSEGGRSQSMGSIQKFERLKSQEDMTAEYQSEVHVGGKKLWMTIDTSQATTWVMTMACFTPGCQSVPLFLGFFIPFLPPKYVWIDMFQRGLTMMGTIPGFLGYSSVKLGGKTVIGAPIATGLMDMAMVMGEMSFNHSGAVGLGMWTENMPNWLDFRNPALDLLQFMMCGNVFFPLPGSPIPLMKPFPAWGLPWFFPSGLVWKYSFYFGDRGGCFFMGGKSPSQGKVSTMAREEPHWVMIIPIAIKMLAPSWLFILSDIKVGGKSINPCPLGICKATISSGQFAISGPMNPMMELLSRTTAMKDCTKLADVSFY
eukprot:g1965.t1